MRTRVFIHVLRAPTSLKPRQVVHASAANGPSSPSGRPLRLPARNWTGQRNPGGRALRGSKRTGGLGEACWRVCSRRVGKAGVGREARQRRRHTRVVPIFEVLSRGSAGSPCRVQGKALRLSLQVALLKGCMHCPFRAAECCPYKHQDISEEQIVCMAAVKHYCRKLAACVKSRPSNAYAAHELPHWAQRHLHALQQA